MTGGPHTIPTYIPPDVDLNAIRNDVANGGVSAPANYVPGLRQVVVDARHKGIDLKLVVTTSNPPIDTPLRDIASEVGHANPGSTVLVMSPMFAGTYSSKFDRVTLEQGQDYARTGDPVLSSELFVRELIRPEFPWTEMTIAITVAAAVAVVATRALQVWARRAAAAEAPPKGA